MTSGVCKILYTDKYMNDMHIYLEEKIHVRGEDGHGHMKLHKI